MSLRTKVFLLGLGALTLATLDSASAFQIDPQCQTMKNKIACSCALQNGGHVAPHHAMMTWYYPAGPSHPAVTKCIQANGGEE